MSRFLLLFLYLIWMGWRSETDAPAAVSSLNMVLFFGTYLLMVSMLAAWGRLLARRVGRVGLRRNLRYFNNIVFGAQIFIPAWFVVGVFYLGWGSVVQGLLGPINRWPVQLPGAMIGTLPGLLTWMGLWWAQYPADRALREQNLLIRLDQNLPIYTSPSFGEYCRQNFRLQILFSAVPILMILGVHDAMMIVLKQFDVNVDNGALEGCITLMSALSVFITVPSVLYRILGARPLPASPLRDRMEQMGRSHGLQFRDILLWPTHNRIANALVMGISPRFRYVLLSDLLLAEMSDEQVEAVFAHELGHVAHRHMIWYLIFMVVLMLAALSATVTLQKPWFRLPDWLPADLIGTVIGFGGFLLAFGFVSRRFERQADVFAARTIERRLAPIIITQPYGIAHRPPQVSHVGPVGASIFASALERVALINNMPMGTQRRFEGNWRERFSYLTERVGDLMNNWLHGSISTRMTALEMMSRDPAHTRHFDRRMARLYAALLVALVLSGTLAWAIK